MYRGEGNQAPEEKKKHALTAENLEKNRVEISELKNTVSEIRSSLGGLDSRVEVTGMKDQ